MSLNQWMIKLIKKYQQNKALIGSGRCKHYPSCSVYGIKCYEKFNFFKASFLTVFRIIRCNPLTKKVYDPVPLTKQEKIFKKIKLDECYKFMDYLLEIAKKTKSMSVFDFVDLIHESCFGPYYLKEKIKTKEDLENFLNKNLKENIKEVRISHNFIRCYKLEDVDVNSYFEEIKNATVLDVEIENFYEKIYIFKKLCKEKAIDLDYEFVKKQLDEILKEEIKHFNFNTNYIIKRKTIN